MLYAFIDEQTGFEETPRFLAASCVAVLQSRYNKKVQEVKMLLHQSKEPSFLEQLDEMLSSLDGLAVIGTARLDPQVLRFGEKDGTFDIPKMARTDNAWADIVLLTVAETLKRLVKRHVAFSKVDMYLDQKDLKPKLWVEMKRTLRIKLPKIYRQWWDANRVLFSRDISVRHIKRVVKSRSLEAEDKFQLGTRLADAVVSEAKRHRTGLGRIKYRDLSTLLTEYLQRYDE